MLRRKKETEEETYRKNMVWVEAVHNGAKLYVRRKWWMF